MTKDKFIRKVAPGPEGYAFPPGHLQKPFLTLSTSTGITFLTYKERNTGGSDPTLPTVLSK